MPEQGNTARDEGAPAAYNPRHPRLSSAIMEALMWDCAHTGPPVDGECVDCARLRDAVVVAVEPILREARHGF